jgi:tetratricopeptide (TPR) repeat protein
VGEAAEYWEEVEALFADTVELDAAARAEMLGTRCAGRPRVRAEVESLLEAHGRAAAFLRPLTVVPAGDEAAAAMTTGVGARVGAFRLVSEIGAGGMGIVFRAERTDGTFEQRVAVKLVTASIHHPDAARRFRAERQILASLRHANIVTLLDGGVTAEGQPYLVMEHVDGVPITVYCRERRLPPAERLALFGQVCAAVQYAHRHFVVHRDLKPANILVTTDGLVKVLDFGVAKLLEGPGTRAAEAPTVAGLGPLTPNYASPEQLRGSPITTSSDVYALGVLLYELLTGGRPYETEGKPLDEILRVVLEGKPPRRGLRGDLDAVVARAMAKEPERRYASAEELAGDVSRYLQGQPVVARTPSLAYLLRKLAARHRAAVAVAAVSLCLLVAALGVVVRQRQVARRAQARAEKRFEDVRSLANTLIFKIHDAVEPLAGSTPVRQTILSEALTYLDGLAAESAEDPALRLELARAYVRIGKVQHRRDGAALGDREAALVSQGKARELVRTLVDAPRPAPAALAAWADVHLALADLLEGAESLAAARQALEAASRRLEAEPGSADAQALLARTHFRMAMEVGAPASLAHWLEAGRLFDRLLAEDPDNANKQRNVALVAKYLGDYYKGAGDLPRALEHRRRALELDEKRAQRFPDDMNAQNDLAIDLGAIATSLADGREYAEAIRLYERSLAIRRRISDADPANVYARGRVAFGHYLLVLPCSAMGQEARAIQHARRAIAIYEPLTAIDRGYKVDAGAAWSALARVQDRAGRRAAACEAYRSAHALFAAGPAVTDPVWRADVDRTAGRAERCRAARPESAPTARP